MKPLFPTVAANWENFEKIDMAPNAPQVQHHEMQRTFYAGAASGVMLAAAAYDSGDFLGEILKINAELLGWVATRKMRGGA